MIQDLEVYIVQGGFIPLKEAGIYPPYLYFTSRSLSLRTGKRKIIKGNCSGYVSKNKKKLFYFEYAERDQECRVYPLNENERTNQFYIPNCSIVLVD